MITIITIIIIIVIIIKVIIIIIIVIRLVFDFYIVSGVLVTVIRSRLTRAFRDPTAAPPHTPRIDRTLRFPITVVDRVNRVGKDGTYTADCYLSMFLS